MDFGLGLAATNHLMPGDWNELHPYLVGRAENVLNIGPFDGYSVGAFKNSEGNLSLTAGLTGDRGPWWWEFGLATGYSDAPVVPFSRAGYETENGLRAFMMPGYNSGTGDLGLVLGIERDLINW